MGLTHAFDQKILISSLVRFDQNKTRNNAQTLQSKKKPFGAIKSRIFQSPKNRIFPKGLTHASAPKNANFFFNRFWSKQD